ncbi:expressed unknown protein [Seminavis robusta]|uniref:Fatty acid hydroxylase domain-containing protein n=1 Tax=Seminavis robusta TaxID=568900 RepID=A0A9N8E0B8_9STRA|nr:expressed unknown protein [Seminavis robusta]|eukprot:Sro409_g137130.1 n/a (241) ;mRNA; r:15803-16621
MASASAVVALTHAVQAALALSLSHWICCCIIMHFDLSGKWAKYALHKTRDVSVQDYLDGAKSFVADLFLLFIPFMTACFWYRQDEIQGCHDSISVALTKLASGYIFGKLWAFLVHYVLHFPAFYQFHRQHHCNPKKLVAARAWQDSYVEYAIMELPSFGITLMLFPTRMWAHLVHFAWHGWDGACGHSGFGAPGILGYIFDGEYHYYHHAHLTVNYAEVEFLDKLFGTHHSQQHKAKRAA